MPLKPTIGHLDPKSDRAEMWLEVYGSLEVPLKSPIAKQGMFPDPIDGSKLHYYYEVDLKQLTPEQLDKAAEIIGRRFGIPAQEIRQDIERQGIPVLADDVSVSFDARLVL
jgi:hypothetical protein